MNRMNFRLYTCAERVSEGCQTTGRLINGQMTLNREHNHPIPIEKAQKEDFKDALWSEVQTSGPRHSKPRAIYNKVAERMPEASITNPFPSLERDIKRWRTQNIPPIPSTLNDFQETINLEKWGHLRNYPGGSLTVNTIRAADGSFVTIFGDPEFLATLPAINELFIDGTFDIRPSAPPTTQFLTIMGLIDDTPEPLAWALTERKTTEAYYAIFNYLKAQLAPGLRPVTVHKDFELAMSIALRQVYPGIIIVPCYFHHCQALLRRLKTKNSKEYMERFSKWPLALVFFRKLSSLACRHPNVIVDRFNWLITNTAPDIRGFFDDLISYYRSYWLEEIKPEHFSVHGHRQRTNNNIETYHKVLRDEIGKSPSMWELTAQLARLQGRTRAEVGSLNLGLPVRRTRERKHRDHEKAFKRWVELSDENLIDTPRSFACSNHLTESFNNPWVIRNVDDVDLFRTIAAHDIDANPPYAPLEVIPPGALDETTPITFVRKIAAGEIPQIIALVDIEQSLCPECRQSIVDVICIPCQHFFYCEECTEVKICEAERRGYVPTCRICQQRTVYFKTVPIS